MAAVHPIAIINGLRIAGRAVADTKPSRILSGLLARPNEVVDGDSLVEAGWYDDLVAGRTDKVRGTRGAMLKLLEGAGVGDVTLESKGGGGAYQLGINAKMIDLSDIALRRLKSSDLKKSGEALAALKQLEPVVPLLHAAIESLGAIRPPIDTAWAETLNDAINLRERTIVAYFAIIVNGTNFDPNRLLLALTDVDLDSLRSPSLWELRIGLTAHLGDPQGASEELSSARIALNRLGVPHDLDSQTVGQLQTKMEMRLEKRSGKPTYDIASGSAELNHTGNRPTRAVVSAIRSDLIADRERLLSLKITGSSTLTLRDMDSNPSLRMPAHATIRSGAERNHSIVDVVTHLTEMLRSNGQQYLIVAPPGAGKSLVCRLVFLALAARSADNASLVPGLVDLRGPDLAKAAELTAGRDVILMDSLDELLASGTLAQVRSAIEDETLEHADVIACRTQFYEQFLIGTTLVEGRTVIEIRAWDVPTIERYIDAYHRHIFHNDDLGVIEDLKRRLESPNVEALLSIPLRLNMALDLIPPGENNLPLELNSLSLHRQWIEQTLRNEAARRGSSLDAVDKLDYLTAVAWRFYDEGTPGAQAAPSFTDGELRQQLTDILFGSSVDEVKRAARDLQFHSILIRAEQDGSGTTQFDSFEFMHKTFQEFLVARYIINAAKTGPEAAASVFRQYFSPQVSDFIKDELKNASAVAGTAQRLAQNLQGALASYDREAARDPDSIRLRSTIQQVCYYLASLPLEPVRAAMLDRLSRERDPWVARAIAIGLSFGGETRGIDQYLESLRRERQLGRATDANDLNIGYHLSFFGDQPFDPVQPFVDRHLDSVTSTTSRLIYQLSIETDFGSWRLDLYTLIDLYRHRSVSRESSVSTIKENRDRLIWVLKHFQVDPRTKDWPELVDLRELLRELELLDD